jgi:hypothetical protein
MPDIDRAIDTCLEPEALRPHLQRALASHGTIDAVRITKAHRSASLHRDPNPLKFCIEADLQSGKTLKLYGKVYRAGASAQAAQGSDALHVPELDLLLWLWPCDPGLSQLARLLEPTVAQPFWDAPAADVQTPRYEPERRATLRYTHADGRVLYAKTFCDARGHTVYRRFAWMWERSQQDADAPLVARPLQCSVDGRTLWQEAAHGTPLLQWPVSAQPSGDWVLPLAHAIATVHTAPVDLAGPAPRDREHWLAEVRRRRNKISRVLPELTELADATANAIVHAAAHLPVHGPALIHGDFHPDQVWFNGQRIVLFDFDEFALGDPMEDLAEFIVKLPDGGTSSHTSAQLVALWLGGYAQIAPQHFCRQRLRWHMAVQQLLQSTRAFIFQIDDWRGEVRHRLERAHLLATQIDAESVS